MYELSGDLFSIHADGSKRRRLTDTGTRPAESAPAISPDGRLVAYSREKTGRLGWDLWLMRRDGTGQTPLTQAKGLSTTPAWLSAKTLVFTRANSYGGCSALHTIDSDGTHERPFVDPPGDDSSFDPSATRNGSRVAYVSADCEVRLDCCYILVVDSSGRRTSDLDKLRIGGWAFSPAWSPDGRYLAFVGGDVDYSSIFVVRRDGSGLRRVAGGVNEEAGASDPAWSPDGRWIVFSRASGERFRSDLFVVRPDGTGLRRLTRTPGNEESPSWTSAS